VTVGGLLNAAGPLLAGAAGPLAAVAASLMAAAIQMQIAASLQLAANTASVLHSGGVVGRGSNRTRSVSPAVFAGAPRYHDGTVVGLKRDEQAAILQNGEEVLSKDDPRNIVNGGAAATGNMAGALLAAISKLKMNVKVVNAIDSGDMVSKALNTKNGESAVLNFIRSRSATIGGLLGTNGKRG
jgi:hypothetical protein